MAANMASRSVDRARRGSTAASAFDAAIMPPPLSAPEDGVIGDKSSNPIDLRSLQRVDDEGTSFVDEDASGGVVPGLPFGFGGGDESGDLRGSARREVRGSRQEGRGGRDASSAASAGCGALELRGNVIVFVGHGCCVMPCPPVRVTLDVSGRGQRGVDRSSS